MSLSDFQIDIILREYDKKRLYHKNLQDERIKEIYSKIPAIKTINEEIAKMSVLYASSKLNGKENSFEKYKKDINDLKKRKEELLNQNHYPSDYLDLTYDCDECKDSGFVDGKKCKCFKKAELELLYNYSNLKHILEKENFSNFNYDYFPKTLRNEYTGEVYDNEVSPYENIVEQIKDVKRFINEFDNKDRAISNLLIRGRAGSGKTFLTNCIAKELLDRDKSVIYLTSSDFFNLLSLATFSKDSEDGKLATRKVSEIKECDVLIIDDLGAEIPNNYTIPVLFEHINRRIFENKSTIISTNLDLNDLRNLYSERLSSRFLQNYAIIHIYGEDLRTIC